MDISDVVGKLRETQLQQHLKLQALQSQVDMLERFTWNIIRLASEGTLEVSFVDSDSEEESTDGDPTLF